MLRTTTLTPMAHLICVAHTRLELAEILVAFRKAGVREPDGARRRPADRPRRRPRRARSTPSSSSSWPGPSAASRSAWPPTRPATRPRRTWRATATTWPRSCDLADFGDHPVLLRGRRVPRAWSTTWPPGASTSRSCPGIMPVTALSSIPRMAEMGAAVPAWMVARLEEASARGGAEAVRQAGIELATELCADSCSTRGRRACTSTRSTARARPGRSTPPRAGRRARPGRSG